MDGGGKKTLPSQQQFIWTYQSISNDRKSNAKISEAEIYSVISTLPAALFITVFSSCDKLSTCRLRNISRATVLSENY